MRLIEQPMICIKCRAPYLDHGLVIEGEAEHLSGHRDPFKTSMCAECVDSFPTREAAKAEFLTLTTQQCIERAHAVN